MEKEIHLNLKTVQCIFLATDLHLYDRKYCVERSYDHFISVLMLIQYLTLKMSPTAFRMTFKSYMISYKSERITIYVRFVELSFLSR